jgi:hypothetical protein
MSPARSSLTGLKHHVLPELSDLPLAEVRARHVVDLLRAIERGR